jgi:hypothetical protein
MEKFSAHKFFDIGRILEALRLIKVSASEESAIKPDGVIPAKWLPDLREKCEAIGLQLSAKYIVRTNAELDKGETTVAEWKEMIPELQHRISDEMEDKLFMYIPSERADR